MHTTAATTIGLVDDHGLFRQTFATILSQTNQYTVSLQAANGQELQAALTKAPPPDVLLLDIQMPVMDGLATLEWLQEAHPALPVIMLTSHDTLHTAANLLAMGARAIVGKTTDLQEVQKAIGRVLDEGYYFPSQRLRQLFQQHQLPRRQRPGRPANISKRELRLMLLVGQGRSNTEIAGILNSTEAYVKKCLNELFQKLEVPCRASLTRLAAAHGILASRGGGVNSPAA